LVFVLEIDPKLPVTPELVLFKFNNSVIVSIFCLSVRAVLNSLLLEQGKLNREKK